MPDGRRSQILDEVGILKSFTKFLFSIVAELRCVFL